MKLNLSSLQKNIEKAKPSQKARLSFICYQMHHRFQAKPCFIQYSILNKKNIHS